MLDLDENLENLEFHNNIIIKNLVFVTGIGASGKSMLAPVVSSLKGSERIMFNYILEQYSILHYIGKMSKTTAIYLIRYTIDLMFYNNMIGRDANFRFSDETSIWNTRNPIKYIKRLFSDEGNDIYDKKMDESSLTLLSIHNGIWYSNIYFEAFPTLKMLQCQRNPIDIIYRWIEKGFGPKFYSNYRNRSLTYKWKNNIVRNLFLLPDN